MKNAFNYCLTGRWFVFELKPSPNSTSRERVVDKFRIPHQNIDDFVPIYLFLKNEFFSKIELNFSHSLESIIDETVNESVLEEDLAGPRRFDTQNEG